MLSWFWLKKTLAKIRLYIKFIMIRDNEFTLLQSLETESAARQGDLKQEGE